MEQIINATVEALRLGETILYPTDTIWGIGCDARNAAAVERLYAIKERDRSKSMLVLVGDQWSETNQFPDAKENLSPSIFHLSPFTFHLSPFTFHLSPSSRPTTYILPREVWEPMMGGLIAPNLPADDGSLGVRCPAHDFCRQVINRLGAPLVSTSANLSGHPSPANYDDIDPELRRRVDYCVPPHPALLSHETRGSRILRLSPDGTLTVLRP